jgi:hypothetical protein
MLIIKFIILSLFTGLIPQNKSLDIEKRLDLINSGKLGEVRKELPSLKKNYPNNAGVLYLQALLTDNAEESFTLYSRIVRDFPKSDWREESLYKLYQYYLITNNTKKSAEKYKQLVTQYPKTKLLNRNSDQPTGNLFTIQIGAFGSKESAKNLSEVLEEKGYKTKTIEKRTDDKTLYKIFYGKYSNKSDAEKVQKEIEKKLNLVTIITNY